MYKAFGLTLLLVALVPLAGCGSKADSLFRQQIAEMNRLADALESGKSQAEIDKLEKRMQTTGKEIGGLNLSRAEEAELAKKYAKDLVQATTRLGAAQVKKMGGKMPKMPSRPPGFD